MHMDEKKRVSVNEVMLDFRSGFNDRELMAKYGLSPKQLDEVYRRLVQSGRLTQAEVDARRDLLDDVLEFDDEPLQERPQVGKSGADTQTDRRPIPPSPGSVDSLPPQPENWQKKAALGIIGGIAITTLGVFVPAIGTEWAIILFLLMEIVGCVLQIWGCYYLAKGKGYHGALCILGVLCFPGLLILLVLPNKYGGDKTSGLMIALVVFLISIVVIAIVGIILAIAIPYYIAFKRAACDRAAHADVLKLAAAFEHLGKELADRNLRLDDEAITRVVENNAVQHMVGPYYGFEGCTGKCEVLIRLNRHQDRWVIEGTALKGSHPQDVTSHYVYRAPIAAGGDLPAAVIAKDVVNARNGESRDWNSYPYAPTGQPEICYAQSIIQDGGPPGKRTFSIKIPSGVPCSKLGQQ